MARPSRRTLAVAAAGLLLSGCGGETPGIDPGDAAERYEAVRTGIIEALGATVEDFRTETSSSAQERDGSCVLDLGSWVSEDEQLIQRELSNWQPLLRPINVVLHEYGFARIDGFERLADGAFGFESTDEAGALLRVAVEDEATSRIAITGVVIDTEDCTEAGLQMPTPTVTSNRLTQRPLGRSREYGASTCCAGPISRL